MDKIKIKGLKVFAYHGVNESEKENGQNFLVDICMWVNIENAAKTDNVENTVSYSQVAKQVANLIKETKFDLIETLCDRIAFKILKEHKKVHKVKVTVKKPDAPMSTDVLYTAVSIKRTKKDYE